MILLSDIKGFITTYWGTLLMLLFTGMVVGMFYLFGVDLRRDDLVQFVDLFFQVFLTLVVVMTSIGAIHIQTAYKEYAKPILEDYISDIISLTFLLLVTSFAIRFVNIKSAGSLVIAVVSFLWLVMSVLLVQYVFSKLKVLFTISPATIAKMVSKDGRALASILKKTNGNPWEVFPYLHAMLDLIKVSLSEPNSNYQTANVANEISKSIEYAEYWDPQWWRLHTWIQVDVLGPQLEALFKYWIPSSVVIPIKEAHQKDPTLVFSVRSIFENLGEVLVNNYFFIYPAFEDFIRNLEELSKIDLEFKKIEKEMLSSALDKLLEFKVSNFEHMKLNREPQCKLVLEHIYNNLAGILEKPLTSVPKLIELALYYPGDTQYYVSLHDKVRLYEKAVEVLKRYPQILTNMFDFELEKLPLGLEVYDITLAFVEYLMNKWDKIHWTTLTTKISENLVVLFQKLKTFGYSIEVSGTRLVIGNKEFSLKTKEQIEFFESAIRNLNTNSQEN